MAKYTELFSEYLQNGGELPEEFDDIEGFEELFTYYFIDKELGFETEALFEIKLNAYAKIFIPIYSQRISDLSVAITGARNPVKTYYDTGSTNVTMGAQKGSQTTLPVNSTIATPSAITATDEYQNDTSLSNTREESGKTITEAYKVIDELNKQVQPLIYKLLKEFDRCFMGCYK